jgi:uncharacterized membrane protein YkvA (DUF1232 family)
LDSRVQIKTVGDLRRFLDDRKWSCETLAEHVPVSNMTWRRLLEKPDHTLFPEKYRRLIEESFLIESPGADSLDPIELVLSGRQQTPTQFLESIAAEGLSVLSLKKHQKLVAKAQHSISAPASVIALVQELKQKLPSVGRTSQALILGGLAYFLNPVDLINDGIIALGFIDDIGVLTLIRAKCGGKPA